DRQAVLDAELGRVHQRHPRQDHEPGRRRAELRCTYGRGRLRHLTPRTMGLFDRLKQRLTKTREAISDGISSVFRGGRPIDRALLDELEAMLYTSDLGPVASDLVASIERKHKRGELK